MDRSLKIILAVLAILILINLVLHFTGGNSNLKVVLQDIKRSQLRLDTALTELNHAREEIDSLQRDFLKFNNYILDIQGRVEIMDLERRVNDQRFRMKRDSIVARLKELYKEIEITGEDLPPVLEYDSRNQ
jgi:hypothetical protein